MHPFPLLPFDFPLFVADRPLIVLLTTDWA